MEYRVSMQAFGYGPAYPVRVVEVPDHIVHALSSAAQGVLLENIYALGQNDFQPQPLPSVSVGDVILGVAGADWRVERVGFKPNE